MSKITKWWATAALAGDVCILDIQVADGRKMRFDKLTPERLAAVIAILESSEGAYISGTPENAWISNDPNAPGSSS